MVRQIKWDDVLDDAFDLSGDVTGWGINLRSNLKASESDVIRLQLVFGEGIQNYMNDSPVDIGIVANPGNPVTPLLGEPVAIVGIVAFLDHTWNEEYSTTIGYSYQDNDNTAARPLTPSGSASIRSATCSIIRSPTSWWAANSSGATTRTSRTD